MSFSKFFSVFWVVFFWFGGLVFLVGFSEFMGVHWWLHFFARDWNLHTIVSHVVGALGLSFMGLDAAWHGWILVALPVMFDGVLAVSAQCGCCHH